MKFLFGIPSEHQRLYPDQAPHLFVPYPASNCLQRLSAVKEVKPFINRVPTSTGKSHAWKNHGI